MPRHKAQLPARRFLEYPEIRLQVRTLRPPLCVRLVSATSHFPPQRRIGMQSLDCSQQLFIVVIQKATLTLFDHLRHTPDVAGDRGRSCTTCFEESDREDLVAQGRHYHRYRMTTIVLKFCLCDVAKEAHIRHSHCLMAKRSFVSARARN